MKENLVRKNSLLVLGKKPFHRKTASYHRFLSASLESFRCNTCELTPGLTPGLKIAFFYVATSLATEQFPWHSHTSMKGLKKTIFFRVVYDTLVYLH